MASGEDIEKEKFSDEMEQEKSGEEIVENKSSRFICRKRETKEKEPSRCSSGLKRIVFMCTGILTALAFVLYAFFMMPDIIAAIEKTEDNSAVSLHYFQQISEDLAMYIIKFSQISLSSTRSFMIF